MRTRGLCGRAHTVDRHGRARRTFATTGGANVRPRASRRAPGAFAPAPPYCAVSARRDSSERPSGAPDRAHSKRLTRLLAVPVRPRAELAEVADDLAVLRLEGAVLADLREVAAAGPAVDRALAVEGPDGVGARAGVDPGRPVAWVDDVVARAAAQDVALARGVAARVPVAPDDVLAGAAGDGVVAVVAEQLVVVRAAGDRVPGVIDRLGEHAVDVRPARVRDLVAAADRRVAVTPRALHAGVHAGARVVAALRARRGAGDRGGRGREQEDAQQREKTPAGIHARERSGIPPATGVIYVSFQSRTTRTSRSKPSTHTLPVERYSRPPKPTGSSTHRAASARRMWPCANAATSPSTDRISSMTRSHRAATSSAVSPFGTPSRQRYQSGRSERMSAVVIPS